MTTETEELPDPGHGPLTLHDLRGEPRIRAWIRGVPLDAFAHRQVRNAAAMPFIYRWIALMPDVHVGIGATVGSVIPTKGAIIPAAVGVDIGCGMMAQETTLRAEQLPDDLKPIRLQIEAAVPHGDLGSPRHGHEKGGWKNPDERARQAWRQLAAVHDRIAQKHAAALNGTRPLQQLGTLGGGNHFIELCLDERGVVWVLLHSGSRGVGNRLGQYFIQLAREDMQRHEINLPDRDLAYFNEGTGHFEDYFEAVDWAQNYARLNRELMMARILRVLTLEAGLPPFELGAQAVNCHHNYVAREEHFGERILVTRKGAVRAGAGELGIIPGSMGARSFIVRGKGNAEAFHSCSHGAGRVMSRGEAKQRFTVEEHAEATAGVECRKDAGVLDETPRAYKDIDAVMAAQRDLVEVVHTLKQVVCVKG